MPRNATANRVLAANRVAQTRGVAVGRVVATSALLTNLISYWKLDETSGSRVDSVVASGNNLTDNNTVTQAAGKVGNAGQFTRANTETLSLASNANIQAGDISFTFTCWIYYDTDTSFMVVLSKDGDGVVPGDREYVLLHSSGVDRLIFQVFRATDSPVGVTADNFGAIPTATWLFVECYYDAVNDVVGIRVNNGTANTTATGGALQVASSNAFAIGGRIYIGAGNLPWNGRIDEVGFWKRVLTATERTNLYNAGAGVTYPFTGIA